MMNIRRLKKKKVIKLVPDKERSATDKLFEISWMWEEKEQDQSTVLIDQGKMSEDKAQIICQTIIKNSLNSRVGRKEIKSTSIEKYRENRHYDFDEKETTDITLRNSCCIFNAITSNRVFVGTVKPISTSRQHKYNYQHQSIPSPRRRVDTMPMINLKWPNQAHRVQGCESTKTTIFPLAKINFKHQDKSLRKEKKKNTYS